MKEFLWQLKVLEHIKEITYLKKELMITDEKSKKKNNKANMLN